MKYLPILFLLLIFLFIGCNPSSLVLMDEYKGKEITEKDLTIIKLFQKPIISNADDVVDDLGSGVPDEVYMSFFETNFTRGIRRIRSIKQVNFVNEVPISGFEERILDINNKEKMKFLLPKDSSRIEGENVSDDFILFIDNLQVSTSPGSRGMLMGGMLMGGSLPALHHQVYFVLWDNQKGKIVSYGRAEEESPAYFGMTRDNWEGVLNGLTIRILECSPFPIQNDLYRMHIEKR